MTVSNFSFPLDDLHPRKPPAPITTTSDSSNAPDSLHTTPASSPTGAAEDFLKATHFCDICGFQIGLGNHLLVCHLSPCHRFCDTCLADIIKITGAKPFTSSTSGQEPVVLTTTNQCPVCRVASSSSNDRPVESTIESYFNSEINRREGFQVLLEIAEIEKKKKKSSKVVVFADDDELRQIC